MTERDDTAPDPTRLVAWAAELRAVHGRLREALRITRATVAVGGDVEPAERDLLVYCHGFCTALSGHHRGEDDVLLPAALARNPALDGVVEALQQDHVVIGGLLADLQVAIESAAAPDELCRHLDGIAAIMESHFAYEERRLAEVLATLRLTIDPYEALGPL